MGFEDTYAELFGTRWPALRAALTVEGPFSLCLHPAAGLSGLPNAEPLEGLEGVLVSPVPFDPPPAVPGAGPADGYAMDAASVLVARALEVGPGDRVLDLCAAPGGKAWILASALGAGGELVANDRSAARRARLHRVLDGMLSEEQRARVRVTGHDGARWGMHEPRAYDRVLLDAPCSSERHVLASARALRQWSPARSRQLARRQYALLAAAVDATRPGGRVVYATCALAPEENDGVVERTLGSKRGKRLEPVRGTYPLGEATELGWRVLPDTDGFGPMYFAVLDCGDD